MEKRRNARTLIMTLILCLGLLMVMLSGCTQETTPQKKDSVPAGDQQEAKGDVSQEKASSVFGDVLFWHTYSDNEEAIFNERLLPQFNQLYPNVKVESVRMPYEGLKQQVVTAVSGGVAPDLMRMDIIWVPEFAEMGALQCVEDMPGMEAIKEAVYEGPLSTNYYDGRLYGLPLDTNTKIAIYNKSLLEAAGTTEPPKTFDQLIELARALKGSEDVYGINPSGVNPWCTLPYFWTLGGEVTDEKFTVASSYLNSGASVAALEKLVSLYNEGLFGPCILGEEPSTWGGMESGNYMMIDDGPWYFQLQDKDFVENNVVGALMPEDQGRSISVIGGQNLVMFKGKENTEATWSLAEFMLSMDFQVAMSECGFVPTLKAAVDREELKSNELIKLYMKQLETAKPRTPHYAWGKIEEELQLMFEKAFRGEGEPKALLDESAAMIDGFLTK